MENFTEITEGQTKLLVPNDSLEKKIPPHYPAFFNPLAKLNRDISMYIYNAFLDEYYSNNNQVTFADVLGGIGSRGLRVAVEVPRVSKIYINDINELAINAARHSASLNNILDKCFFSINDVCKFLVLREVLDGKRFSIIDLDPFGSPSPFIDCVLRAIEDNGLISITATDTAVLSGKYQDVCLRKYFGVSINNTYSNETATRLLLSSTALTAARLGMYVTPIFVHSNRHYFRIFLKFSISNSLANKVFSNIGYIYHCFKCGNRGVAKVYSKGTCNICGNGLTIGGPLWIGKLYDKNLISKITKTNLAAEADSRKSNQVQQIFSIGFEELDDIAYYFSLDEIGSILKKSPIKLTEVIQKLSSSGYLSSKTIFRPTAFKTTASLCDILYLLS